MLVPPTTAAYGRRNDLKSKRAHLRFLQDGLGLVLLAVQSKLRVRLEGLDRVLNLDTAQSGPIIVRNVVRSGSNAKVDRKKSSAGQRVFSNCFHEFTWYHPT